MQQVNRVCMVVPCPPSTGSKFVWPKGNQVWDLFWWTFVSNLNEIGPLVAEILLRNPLNNQQDQEAGFCKQVGQSLPKGICFLLWERNMSLNVGLSQPCQLFSSHSLQEIYNMSVNAKLGLSSISFNPSVCNPAVSAKTLIQTFYRQFATE